MLQNMFLELENFEILHKSDQPQDLIIQQDSAIDYINSIRLRFGLDIAENKNQEILESLFHESNIIGSSALQIKIENEMNSLDMPDAEHLSDTQEYDEEYPEELEQLEEDELESETSSNIEQLSESKLTLRYEEIDEGKVSESENGTAKRKKRKNRSSDEEKLFE